MDLFQKLGEGAGSLAGGVMGGALNFAGELTQAKVLQEAGSEVFAGNKKAGKYAGQTLDGVIDSGIGLIKRDRQKMQQGRAKLAEVLQMTTEGIIDSVDFAQEQITEAYEGGKEMDGARLAKVARNTGKALLVSGAVFSVFQVGKGLKIKVK